MGNADGAIERLKGVLVSDPDNRIINEFNGWDYTELIAKWDLYNETSLACTVVQKVYEPEKTSQDDSKPIRQFLEDLLTTYFATQNEEVVKPFADDIRRFARKLSVEDMSYYRPLWRGLSRIEDDFTIVRATILLVPTMWA